MIPSKALVVSSKTIMASRMGMFLRHAPRAIRKILEVKPGGTPDVEHTPVDVLEQLGAHAAPLPGAAAAAAATATATVHEAARGTRDGRGAAMTAMAPWPRRHGRGGRGAAARAGC